MQINLVNLVIFLLVTMISPYIFLFSEEAGWAPTVFGFCLGILTVLLFPIIQDPVEDEEEEEK